MYPNPLPHKHTTQTKQNQKKKNSRGLNQLDTYILQSPNPQGYVKIEFKPFCA